MACMTLALTRHQVWEVTTNRNCTVRIIILETMR